jgi:hypothetical protein
MKILALEQEIPGVTGDQFKPHLRAEAARIWELYQAGADTLDKIAGFEPEALLQMTTEFVEHTGFDGIAPLPKEVRNAVTTARKLPKLVEW